MSINDSWETCLHLFVVEIVQWLCGDCWKDVPARNKWVTEGDQKGFLKRKWKTGSLIKERA